MSNSLSNKVALDTNSFSYLYDAINSDLYPNKKAREQQIALIRIWFYGGVLFFLPNTVRKEYDKIRIEEKKKGLNSLESIHLQEGYLRVESKIHLKRVCDYFSSHNKENDCMILVEAEIEQVDWLLTYDKKYYKKLKGVSESVKLAKPTDYWNHLNIPRGISPEFNPHSSNPLARVDWWHW